MGVLDDILAVRGPDGQGAANGVARGLPRAAYTSEEFLTLEYQRLFARTWVFAGFAHTIAAPGDVVPVTAAGQPIILLRNGEGEIKAFHNVCRHRGAKLVGEACTGQNLLTCRYHSWAYDLDGRLIATPHFGGFRQADAPGFKREDHGLLPLRCAHWHDWIFVNLDGAAVPLDDYLRPLAQQLDGLDFSKLTPIATLDFGTVESNWKFLVENFVEPYHVPIVHPKSASGQRLRDHYMIAEGNCVGCAVEVRKPPESGADSAGPLTALDMSSRYLAVVPNFVLGLYLPDQVGVHLNVPLAPGRTRQTRVIYHLGDQLPSKEVIDGIAGLWRQVHREDREIVELLQAGRASPATEDGGLLSPAWETSVQRFHELVIDALRKEH